MGKFSNLSKQIYANNYRQTLMPKKPFLKTDPKNLLFIFNDGILYLRFALVIVTPKNTCIFSLLISRVEDSTPRLLESQSHKTFS